MCLTSTFQIWSIADPADINELLEEFSENHNVAREALHHAGATLLQKKRLCNTILDQWIARTEGNNLAMQIFRRSYLNQLGNPRQMQYVTETWCFDSPDDEEVHENYLEWDKEHDWLNTMPGELDRLRWQHYYKYTVAVDDRIESVSLLKKLFVIRRRTMQQQHVSGADVSATLMFV